MIVTIYSLCVDGDMENSASYMSQTHSDSAFGSWFANDWYRSALCGHLLTTSANNWTNSLHLADMPLPHSATLGLHPVAR